MAFIQEKRVNFIDLLTGTFRELGAVKRELAAYVLVFAALAVVPIYDFHFGWVFMLLGIFAYFVGQYFLYRAMLARAGMLQDEGWRVFQFMFMGFVLIFPISIGFNIFWVPGLILMAKWIMAPAYLVARDRTLFQAIGDSWQASEFNTMFLTLAVTAVCAIWFFGFIPVIILWDLAPYLEGGMTSIVLWMHLLPIMLAGLSMSAYRQLCDDTASLSEVFA